jgi:multidrug efflux pump subunit AcrA (membrane-fusion protein)
MVMKRGVVVKRPLTIIALVSWIAVSVACTSSPTAPGVGVTSAQAASPVSTQTTSGPAVSPDFVSSGPIIVENQVDVAAQRDGVIAKVLAEPGTPVKPGQLLATLDDRQISADLDAARAKTRSTENDLEKTRITAPFGGVVARRYVRVGQSVVKNERLFWVTATEPMRIRVTLPERFLGRIKTGTMVGVTPADDIGASRRYSAKVIQVSPVVDPASDTIEILAQLYGTTSGLRPGMRVDLHVPQP